ncbi:DsbA family protein [Cellulosimicrobium cellulans]|uniref:DsbA family protein n=1 Tax=Cellulosimicrobium cellulans TaxID=1710 RepID=UPI000DF813C7
MPSNETQTKAQRREAARAEALALREAQAKRDKRNRLITIGALVAGVLVLVGVFLAVWIPAMNDRNKTIDAVAAGNLADVTNPATSDAEDGGIPIGADGAAGTENEGAVEVGVYLDYMCPICGQFEETNGATLDQLRESGDVTVVLHPISILDRVAQSQQFSTRSAAAAAWVADRAPESMNDFNTAMFQNQPQEGSGTLTDAQIADIAEQAGVPADVAAGIEDGTAVETFGDWVATASSLVNQDTSLHGERGFGTPTITINGERWEGNWNDPNALPEAVTAAQG